MKISQLTDEQKVRLIDSRWKSSEKVWGEIAEIYERNSKAYDNEPEYITNLPRKKPKVRSNRIFTDTEAVINSLISNPAKFNLLPNRNTDESRKLAQLQGTYFNVRYDVLNVKEVMRKGIRNLYLSRLVVLKPFWNTKINDFDVKELDPRKVRFGKESNNEQGSEFAIEEIEDSILAVIARFPKKRKEILAASGFEEGDDAEVTIQNPTITYKEAWIQDWTMFSYNGKILDSVRNPYWDWNGLLITPEEDKQINSSSSEDRRAIFKQVRSQQDARTANLKARADALKAQDAPDDADDAENQLNQPAPQETDQGASGVTPAGSPQLPPNAGNPPAAPQPPGMSPATLPADQTGNNTLPTNTNQSEPETFRQYFFNHFDAPRKPYIFATVFSNENKPIGRTDVITQAIPLQESVDRRKRQMDDNAEMMNGITKVDSSVMTKAEAQALRYEATGIIYGKNVAKGVSRETGVALPQFIFDDMVDSREEIDNIMAATSAFKGQREGQETKAGRIALIQQSELRLEEFTQVVDYLSFELFNWMYQLAKIRYTEYHYAKTMGIDDADTILELIQDDFEEGAEIRVIPGNTLPKDNQFIYTQAQQDVEKGFISPIDYLERAGYDDPKRIAKNALVYKLNPVKAVGITPAELAQIVPPKNPAPPTKPSESISFKDLPPDGKIQLAEQAGIKLNPQAVIADHLAKNHPKVAESKFTPVPPLSAQPPQNPQQ